MENPASVTIDNDLPAILIGGAPDAGKSVLTYNLTRKLRELKIPHYVFRANPDGYGDWYFKMDDGVRQLIEHKEGAWSARFREIVCQGLRQRLLPLIVDLGGRPQEADNAIFRACTHSLLLLKDGEEASVDIWRNFTTSNDLRPLAEIRSQLEGESFITSYGPMITGTMTGLRREKSLHNDVFDLLVKRVCQLFRPYSLKTLEKRHLDNAPQEAIVHLPQRLKDLAPDTEEWTPDLLQPLLAELPTQEPLAVYERGANWVYGALALHAKAQPFCQFDACLGWIEPPLLQSSASSASSVSQELVQIDQQHSEHISVISIKLRNYYIDFMEAGQLALPEPLPEHGIIINGHLPLWLFTALARFYAQRDVSWIALNDASTHKPVVIWSQTAGYEIGQELDRLSL